jgi:hypothetical protein
MKISASVWFVIGGVVGLLLSGGGLLLAPVFPIAKTEPVACVDKDMILTPKQEGWVSCPHASHALTDRPLGYASVLVSCTCVDKDAGSEPLTPEESRILEGMEDAGQQLPGKKEAEELWWKQ